MLFAPETSILAFCDRPRTQRHDKVEATPVHVDTCGE
jgi:hypothetical protein